MTIKDSRLHLRRTIDSIVEMALASTMSVATLEGCRDDTGVDGHAGDAGDASGDPFADEATFACSDPLPDMFANLQATNPVDYFEVRSRKFGPLLDGQDAGVDGQDAGSKLSMYGSPCAKATDRDGCMGRLAAVAIDRAQGWETSGDRIGPNRYEPEKEYIVYTRGDDVGLLSSTADVAQFLSPIDTLEEARLVLRTQNVIFTCTTTPYRSGWRKNADDDAQWEFIVVGRGCGTLVPFRDRFQVTSTGSVITLLSTPRGAGGCGRRPEGLKDPLLAPFGRTGVGEHFASMAHLEAASVIAFRRLELELRRLGAPADLVTRARRSRKDEIRHAREIAHVARRLGAVVPPVVALPATERDLLAIALENMVEGCVSETYGAFVAAFQAKRAAPELRPLLQRIAGDEARHAELAHDVATWLDGKLSPAERATVAAARDARFAELRAASMEEPPADVVRYAGMPAAREAMILVDGLGAALLAA